MEQEFIKQTINNYDHLCGKYLGCFCKDKMDKLFSAIVKERSLHDRIFALINTGTKASNGEHWMGMIINRQSNASRYFDSFGRSFPWLIDTLKEHLKYCT